MAPDRRRVFLLLGLGAAVPWLAAFSPRGLDAWRQHSLFVLFHEGERSDRETASLVTSHLVERLPESRAQPLPVADLRQLGELLLSRQYDVALLSEPDLKALIAHSSVSGGATSGPLVLIAKVRDHLLVCRSDFAAEHAVMIASALSDLASKDTVATAPPLAWHPAVGR
jgi:hypothetical protein